MYGQHLKIAFHKHSVYATKRRTKQNEVRIILSICGIFMFAYAMTAILLFYGNNPEHLLTTTCVIGTIAGGTGVIGWIVASID